MGANIALNSLKSHSRTENLLFESVEQKLWEAEEKKKDELL